MKRIIATIAVLGPALLIVALSGNSDKPKATASPAPIIDHSAELAALQAENADLKESLRVAQSAIHAAPLAVTAPGGADQNVRQAHISANPPGKRSVLGEDRKPQPAAYVAAPRPVQSCAGGVCMPAAQGPRYQYQSRSSQPRRFVGRLFGRR
jgi:hypothetical protein